MCHFLFFHTESFAIQPLDGQNVPTKGQLADLYVPEMKLGSLVLKFEEIMQQSRSIDVHQLKKLLKLTYSRDKELHEEIECAKDLSEIFIVVRNCCSPFNIDVLLVVVDHFKLPNSDRIRILELIHEYEEPHYRKKMYSIIELAGLNPLQYCFVTLKLKAFVCITVKQFAKIMKDLFHNLYPYTDICIVGVASFASYIISVIIRAPKPLTKDLQIVVKNNSCFICFGGTTILFSMIDNEIILDRLGVGTE